MGLDGADEEHDWLLAGSQGEARGSRPGGSTAGMERQMIVCDCGSGLSQSWGESCRGPQHHSPARGTEGKGGLAATTWQQGEWEAWAQTARDAR